MEVLRAGLLRDGTRQGLLTIVRVAMGAGGRDVQAGGRRLSWYSVAVRTYGAAKASMELRRPATTTWVLLLSVDVPTAESAAVVEWLAALARSTA